MLFCYQLDSGVTAFLLLIATLADEIYLGNVLFFPLCRIFEALWNNLSQMAAPFFSITIKRLKHRNSVNNLLSVQQSTWTVTLTHTLHPLSSLFHAVSHFERPTRDKQSTTASQHVIFSANQWFHFTLEGTLSHSAIASGLTVIIIQDFAFVERETNGFGCNPPEK